MTPQEKLSCPECNILLTQKTQQKIDIDGDGNQAININGSSDGDFIKDSTVINQPEVVQFIQKKENESEVNYTKNTGQIYTTKQALIVPGLISIPGIILGSIHLAGSTASIIGYLSNTDDPFSKPFVGLLFIFILLASLIGAFSALVYLGIVWSGHRLPLSINGHKFLEKQADGTFLEVWFTAPCKTGSCKGTLFVKKAPDNEDGHDYIGKCNINEPQHHYTFDKTEMTGLPVKLTPKKEAPKSNNN